jgi:hypothetical protein
MGDFEPLRAILWTTKASDLVLITIPHQSVPFQTLLGRWRYSVYHLSPTPSGQRLRIMPVFTAGYSYGQPLLEEGMKMELKPYKTMDMLIKESARICS